MAKGKKHGLGDRDPDALHDAAARAWARRNERVRAMVAAFRECPEAELDPSPLASVEAWSHERGSLRAFSLAGEIEGYALGARDGVLESMRDYRKMRRRLGFDPAAVSWFLVAEELIAEARAV